jgi:hypothetical protein
MQSLRFSLPTFGLQLQLEAHMNLLGATLHARWFTIGIVCPFQ